MAVRLGALLPRIVLVTLLALLATATLTFAAGRGLVSSPPRTAPAVSKPDALLVPDVRRQAYVFAKGILQDAGFAWRVAGPVQGYAANVVATQEPAAGTRVVDTGAPTVVLRLARNRQYPQHGTPDNAAPYPGTEMRVAGLAGAPALPPAVSERRPASAPAPARPASRPEQRPPAFLVPGAPREPLDELPLPARARRLDAWLTTHRELTSANVRHWLFEHAWIVTGAELGWWRGAEALRTLIRVDRRAQSLWGIGTRNEAAARGALAEVEARAK